MTCTPGFDLRVLFGNFTRGRRRRLGSTLAILTRPLRLNPPDLSAWTAPRPPRPQSRGGGSQKGRRSGRGRAGPGAGFSQTHLHRRQVGKPVLAVVPVPCKIRRAGSASVAGELSTPLRPLGQHQMGEPVPACFVPLDRDQVQSCTARNPSGIAGDCRVTGRNCLSRRFPRQPLQPPRPASRCSPMQVLAQPVLRAHQPGPQAGPVLSPNAPPKLGQPPARPARLLAASDAASMRAMARKPRPR